MKKILIIDDDTSLTYSLQRAFSSKYRVLTANCTSTARQILGEEEEIGLIFLDYMLGDENGLDVLERLKKDFPMIPVVFMTAYSTSDTVLEAVKLGAVDFLVKPVLPDEFIKTVDTYHSVYSSVCGPGFLRIPEHSRSIRLIGTSRAMRDVLKLTASASLSDAPVLLTGESGTGKDLIANLLHSYSKRSGKPFVAINCAAIPRELLESELFGYVRGAFSGAVSAKTGLLESADCGTVFLDEISEMPVDLQAKMLRVLQNGTIQKLGEVKETKIDVRVISATNKDIGKIISEGHFRADLYYRLSVININIPPLRKRPEDIPELALHLIAKHNERGKITCVDEALLERLKDFNWPGNVRELENRIREAIILAKTNCLTEDDFRFEKETKSHSVDLFEYFKSKYKDNLYNNTIDECERALIEGALRIHGGRLAKAADWLNISRVTLNAKIKKYGLESDQM